MSLAAHNHCIVVVHWSSLPSHRRRPIVEVVIDNVNVEVVVIVVVVVLTAVVFHFPVVVFAITAILVVGVVGICRRVAGGVASC
jgi:cobalamin synthase